MKKLFLLGALLAAVLFVFAACGGNDDNGNNDQPPAGGTNQAGTTGTGGTTPPAIDPADRTPVTITYANWNLGPEGADNIERRLIQAFMDEHPWITVDVMDSYGEDYVEFMVANAAIGNLPDVFMINDTAQALINGWLLDISDLSRNDPEFNRLPTALRNATIQDDRVWTVPFAQFMQGYFVNMTLFDEFNLNRPQFGISPEAWFDAVRNTTDLNRPVVGVNYTFHMALWYPAAVNPNLGFFTFDGNQYNLDSPAMIEGMRIANELSMGGYTFVGLDGEFREATFDGGWHGEVFNNGQIAMRFEGTWFNPNNYDLPFEWDFIGVPGGRNILVIDIMGISANTQHAYEAYLLAKWMGHGDAGFSARMDAAESLGLNVATLPMTNNAAILDRYWAQWGHAPGMMAAYNALDNAIIDGNKVVPGHIPARYQAITGLHIAHYENANMGAAIFWLPNVASPGFADHAAHLNALANQAFQAVNAELELALR